jgi:diguanylate cyclase (GGDEF)-like protein
MSAGRRRVDVLTMNETRAAVWTPVKSTVSLEDTLPKAQERAGAVVICATLLVAAVFAALFGQQTGPDLAPFVLVAATVWSLADLLTAFLLLAQFYVSGTVLFGFLAAAYASSGILTWAYLAAFPGIFHSGPTTHGDQQVSIYMWAIWHCTFPALVIAATFASLALGRFTSRKKIHLMTAFITVAPLAVCAAVCTTVYSLRDALPSLSNDGHFTPLWTSVFVPSIIALNVIACIVLIMRRKRLTALSLWLAVAMFASTLDAILNTSTIRYTYAWDTAKVVTVFTASVVLIMILCDIVGLYGQIVRVSRIDVLTSLANRRAFDEHCQFVYQHARRAHSSVALLLIDIDGFKRFNETYGRVAGDACLQQIAHELGNSATRPLDLVARYAGEKFAVILPDTPLQGVLVIAERVRSAIEGLAVVGAGDKPLGHVTASIGVGYAPDTDSADETALFAAADRALFDAKSRGRNKVMLGSIDARTLNEQLPPVPTDAVVA